MFQRIQKHLKEELGSDDTVIVIGDIEGGDLVLYANRPGGGLCSREGGYRRRVPLSSMTLNQTECMRYKETKFFSGKQSIRKSGTDWSYTTISSMEPDEAESGVIGMGTSYAFVRASKLASYFGIEPQPIHVEAKACHEGAHGIIDMAGEFMLEDLFGAFSAGRESMPEIVDEAVAQLVGLKYLEEYLPEDAANYRDCIAGLETDHTHMEAFRLVLEERERVETMRNVIRMLVKNKVRE